MAVLAIGALVWFGGPGSSGASGPKSAGEGVSREAVAAASGVEVPSVVGDALDEARMIVEAAGLVAEAVGTADDAEVLTQVPAAGEVVAHGTRVVLTVDSEAAPDEPLGGKVIVIDPGHQHRSDMSQEPIGPGSKKMRARVTGGTSGVETGLPECEIVLQIATNLAQRLERAGARVVMTRTTNDVDLGNRERAEIANEAGADAFIRVHANGSPDDGRAGITTLFPASGRWTKPIASDSRQLAESIQRNVIVTTGATDEGVSPRSDLAGFNFSEVPVALIECGYLSNPVEDRLLSSPHYQDKLAEGITQGITEFLASE